MARSFFMPSRSLEFVPDPNHAPGLSRADELARINISVDAEGYVVEGSFSILYDTYVTTSFDGGAENGGFLPPEPGG